LEGSSGSELRTTGQRLSLTIVALEMHIKRWEIIGRSVIIASQSPRVILRNGAYVWVFTALIVCHSNAQKKRLDARNSQASPADGMKVVH
jgi:hypothetical protein